MRQHVVGGWVHTWYKAPQVVPVVGARENVQHAPNDGAGTGRATAWEGVGRVKLTPQADVRVEEPGVVKGTALVLATKDETEGSASIGWMKAGREGNCVLAGSGQTPTPLLATLTCCRPLRHQLDPSGRQGRHLLAWRGGRGWQRSSPTGCTTQPGTIEEERREEGSGVRGLGWVGAAPMVWSVYLQVVAWRRPHPQVVKVDAVILQCTQPTPTHGGFCQPRGSTCGSTLLHA